jgi:crotonobetaine/carnitine-CoA ligase
MPYFMVPRYLEVVSELPKTATLRVKKFELRQRGNTPFTWDREAAGIIIKRQT